MIIKFREAVLLENGEFHSWHYWGNNIPDEGCFSGPCSSLNISYQYVCTNELTKQEIYRKDIVQDVLTKKICVVEYGIFKGRTGTGFGWFLADYEGKLYIPFPPFPDEWKVLGNVIENPDILEKVNQKR